MIAEWALKENTIGIFWGLMPFAVIVLTMALNFLISYRHKWR